MKGLARSFAGGEITPELYGRLDLTKFQTGLALARNFITLPHGPATRRPGFEYTQQCRGGLSNTRVRLIPFAYSADQTMVLEFGHQYIRFHSEGGTLLETAKDITTIDQANDTIDTLAAHNWFTGDWVYLSGWVEEPDLNERVYQIEVVDGNTIKLKTLDSPSATVDLAGRTDPAVGTLARIYQIDSPYNEWNLLDLHFTQSNDVLTITHQSYTTRELRRLGATNWQLAAVSFQPSNTPPVGLTATATVANDQYKTQQEYVVTGIASDGVTESYASAVATCDNNLGLAGNFNTLNWTANGSERYYAYKKRGGIWGYIGQTTSTSLKDDNILPDTGRPPPENLIALNQSPNNYPQAVTYYEQRRWFGGSFNDPQTVWATRSGTESNLTSSLPSQDDDGMRFRIASQQNNAIRHLLPLSDLIALTASGEWRIYSEGAPNITLPTLSVKPQGYAGASMTQPVLTSGSILYVQAQGSRIRELAYNWETNAYRSIDMSIMAPHLFNGKRVIELAYSRAPEQILWSVRHDGTLLGMTYVPEQQVFGWHQHDTSGRIESACCVAEGNEDVLYVVVKRMRGGVEYAYVERLKTRIFTDQIDAFYVDSGRTYSGEPTNVLHGLHHLEGRVVQILADGAVHPERTVVNGTVVLQRPASKVHVGLKYTSDFQTLPLAIESVEAAGQGAQKSLTKAHLRVAQSSLVKAGPDFDHMRDYPARAVSDPYGSPPALRTGTVEVGLDSDWSEDGALCVRQDQPLPLTVAALTLEFEIGG